MAQPVARPQAPVGSLPRSLHRSPSLWRIEGEASPGLLPASSALVPAINMKLG